MQRIVARGSREPLSSEERQGVWDLLCACDDDFLPPLSQRTSSCQTDFIHGCVGDAADGPRRYFEQLMQQEFLLSEDRGSVQGYLSYRLHWHREGPFAADAVYITTVCIAQELRSHGIATVLYRALEERERATGELRPLVIRTWSTNRKQISLLERLGYDIAMSIKDDRGPGIDTVYFRKILNADD